MLYLKITFKWGVNESRYRNPRLKSHIFRPVQGRRQDLMSANGSTNCKRPIQMDARRKSQQLTSWIKRALLRLYGPPLVLIVIVLCNILYSFEIAFGLTKKSKFFGMLMSFAGSVTTDTFTKKNDLWTNQAVRPPMWRTLRPI